MTTPALTGNRAIWSVILLVVALDAIWIRVVGISADAAGIGVVASGVGTLLAIALFYRRTGRADPIMRAANSAAQMVSFTAAASALSYLVMATDAPLADLSLAAADRTLGFDWLSWVGWVQAHPAIHLVLVVAYGSLLYQMVGCVLFLAVHKTADEFLEILIVSGILAIVISGFLPAAGNIPDAPHIPDLMALRAGSLNVIPIGRGSQGLIAFPSFHAALAIIITFAVRETRWLFMAMCLLNFIVLLSVPSEGGHFLVDVFGGVAITCLAIWIIRTARHPRPYPQSSQPEPS